MQAARPLQHARDEELLVPEDMFCVKRLRVQSVYSPEIQAELRHAPVDGGPNPLIPNHEEEDLEERTDTGDDIQSKRVLDREGARHERLRRVAQERADAIIIS